MRTINKKQAIVSILAILVLASLLLAPSTNALGLNYSDNFFNYLSVTSSADVTKPGNFTTVTISGKLLVSQSAIFEVRFYVDTTAQLSALIGSTYLVLPVNYGVGTVIYPILIPLGALNNTYVYASISNGTTVFSRVPITLVQNPTYSELQLQVSQLQSNVSSLTAQLNSLQNQLNTIQANNTNLQAQVNNLTSEKAALQVQVNNLQGNNSALQAQLSILNGNSTGLQSQLNSLQAEKAALQSQVSSLQVEKSNLQAQVADLQTNNAALESQVGDLQSNKTVLQSLVTNLQGNNTELLSQVNDLQFKVNNLQLNNTNLQAIVDTFSLQIASLEQQVSDLQSQNSTNSILMYLATGVAATFIAVTGYFLFVLLKRKKTTAEPSLY